MKSTGFLKMKIYKTEGCQSGHNILAESIIYGYIFAWEGHAAIYAVADCIHTRYYFMPLSGLLFSELAIKGTFSRS